MTNNTASEILRAKVEELKSELPGISFGYVGNVGVDRSGPYDDRDWRVFLPVPPGGVRDFSTMVYLGSTESLPKHATDIHSFEARVRRAYASVR